MFVLTGALYLTASDIISAIPLDGVGKQVASVHSFTTCTNDNERPYNLLYNPAEDKYKWCDNARLFPWVVFELTDIYAINRIVFRDVVPYETDKYGNVPEYWVYVTTEDPSDCGWTEVAHKKGEGSVDVKEIVLDTPVDARYVKLKVSRGTTNAGAKDNAIRLYGVDIYGELAEKIDRGNLLSVGKTVLGFHSINSNETRYSELPLNLFDGNTTNKHSKWYFKDMTASDSLAWVVVDLEQDCDIDGFKLYDARTLEPNTPNLRGYNVYVSPTLPDLSLMDGVEDGNTCWTKVVDAYQEDRSDQNIKTDEIGTVRGRYVKLEVPRSRVNSDNKARIFQFEVYGTPMGATVMEAASAKGTAGLFPNPVRRGDTMRLPLAGEATVQIFSTQGALVSVQQVQGPDAAISTSGLVPGNYLVQVASDDKETTQVSVIVK